MDALLFFKHSEAEDLEIRHALLGIARHMPWVRRVIVFGDRPAFLAENSQSVLHVPHEAIAWLGPYDTPVTNFFLMFYLTALLPELDEEYLWFCDDFILLEDLSIEEARRVRYLEDLGQVAGRGRGLWKDALWRTYDTLTRLGYGGLNFETHVPTYFRKRWVLEAWRDLRQFVTEDRWFGLTGPTAILNHAHKTHGFPVVDLHGENPRAGFYGQPPSYEEVVRGTAGKRYLGFDDAAFGEEMKRFLEERFGEECRFEG